MKNIFRELEARKTAREQAFFEVHEYTAKGKHFSSEYHIVRLKKDSSDLMLATDTDNGPKLLARVSEGKRELTFHGIEPSIHSAVLLEFLKRCEEEFIFQERMKAELEKLRGKTP